MPSPEPVARDATGDAGRRPRISATPRARRAVTRLCAARGGRVMFVQSAGCCAGSTPMCFPDGEFLVGSRDVLLGEIEGCPFYIDAALDAVWGRPDLVLDVADGDPEGFSLGPGAGRHFITGSSLCGVETARSTPNP